MATSPNPMAEASASTSAVEIEVRSRVAHRCQAACPKWHRGAAAGDPPGARDGERPEPTLSSTGRSGLERPSQVHTDLRLALSLSLSPAKLSDGVTSENEDGSLRSSISNQTMMDLARERG